MGRLDDKIFEMISAGLVYLDADFNVVEYNLLGLRAVGADTSLNLAGKPFFDTLINHSAGLRTAFQKVLAEQKQHTFLSYPVLEAGKNEKTYWDYTISNLDGGILLSAVEVTDRVLAERSLQDAIENAQQSNDKLRKVNHQLEEYNRLKAEFVANISHELRTPLTAIIGFAQLMQIKAGKQKITAEDTRDGLERILRNGRHLLTLIDEVLDLSKIEDGRLTLHLEHFDLPEMIEKTFSGLESLALEKGLQYSLEIKDEFPFVFSDSMRVRQIIINLLSNAIKFTQTGSIRVSLETHGDEEWSVRVKDSGLGIKKENLNSIFERFRQLDGSFTRDVGGFGLGLSISQQLAGLLGGKITVESDYRSGSTFRLILPYTSPIMRHREE